MPQDKSRQTRLTRVNVVTNQRTLARLLRRVFAAQARDAVARVNLDGPDYDPSMWVGVMADTVRPAFTEMFQRGMLESEVNRQPVRPSELGREGFRRYELTNDEFFGGSTKGVMWSGRPTEVRAVAAAHVTTPAGAMVRVGEPATGNLRRLLKHPGRLAQILKKVGKDPVAPRVLDAVDELVLRFCRETNRTLALKVREARNEIRDILKRGLVTADGRRRAEAVLARRLRKIINDPVKALQIATTESTRAVNGGRLMAAREAGVKKKRWRAYANACPRCLELDGKVVPLAAPFLVDGVGPYAMVHYPPLHPWCCLGETTVRAPGRVTGIVAQFEGPIVRVTFADGYQVAVTPNHLFLTTTGFVPAARLVKGDDIVRCLTGEGEPLCHPDDDDRPAPIKEVVGALAEASCVPATGVPVAPEYLYGDAAFCKGEIDVVRADSFLGNYFADAMAEETYEYFLGGASACVSLVGQSNLASVLETLALTATGSVGGRRDLGPVFGGATRVQQALGRGVPSHGHATLFGKKTGDRPSADAESVGKALRRLSGEVSTLKVREVHVHFPLHGTTPVYSLQTRSSLYTIGNGVVNSNCYCDWEEVP